MYAFTGTRTPCLFEQELHDRDVPAELAARERARAEERRAERAELAARARVGDPGDVQAVRALERAHRGDRLRPDDRVDRAEVEALRAQGDLQPRVLGIRGRRPRARLPPRAAASTPASIEPEAHESPDYRVEAGFLPAASPNSRC